MNNYCLPDTYHARLEPQYFNDTLPDSENWQADVYKLAAMLARKANVRRLVDIGCGRANKLLRYTNEFQTFGIDYLENIEANKRNHRNHSWYDFDLSKQVVTSAYFIGSVAICADVIEHIPDLTALIETFHQASKTAAYVLISTPDRLRLYGREHNGPPDNLAHVREWTNAEFTRWLKSEDLPVVWSGWTVSYSGQPDKRNTSLVVLARDPHEALILPRIYEPRWIAA